MTDPHSIDLHAAKLELATLAGTFGFSKLGIASIEIPADEQHLLHWLDAGFHGEMEYMRRHGVLRSRPSDLIPGTVRVISARMDYWPETPHDPWDVLGEGTLGYVSRYALGRDYHKILRKALAQLAESLAQRLGPFGYRVCVDSAPVLEKAFARNAGLGWIGKHTNLIAHDAGSLFFWARSWTDLHFADWTRRPPRTVVPARPASRLAPPGPSLPLTSWMPGAAFRI